ncbi:MAG: helix-turn-helix domain-containing protein, partial [Coprobacillaceae bacterium]
MNFGIKLQTLRKEKRMSQEALAEQLGVSRQAVSKWETGEGYPEMDTIIMISNLFGVTLDYLMKGNTEGGEETVSSIDEDSVVLSTTELEDFINFKKRFFLIIGISVATIIVAVSLNLFFPKSTLAIGAMLLIIALAVGSMIIVSILSGKYEYLDTKHILLKPSDLEIMKEKQKKFNTTFAIMIAAGVFIIIAALAITMLFEERNSAIYGYFLWAVAVSVFIFIYVGCMEGLYRQICNNKEFIKET